MLNHINLYKVSPNIVATLMPTGNLKEYSRLYNILIFGSTHTYFPTGHVIPHTRLAKEFNAYHNNSRRMRFLLGDVIVTEELAKQLNDFATYLYTIVLPDIIVEDHQKFTRILARKLKTPLSFAPNIPSTPHLQRLNAYVTPRLNQRDRPLTFHGELTILRLPMFHTIEKAPRYNQQDFQPHKLGTYLPHTRNLKLNRKEILIKLKRDRVKLLLWVLPRLTASPEAILSHAQHKFTHTSIESVDCTPHNHRILHTSPLISTR